MPTINENLKLLRQARGMTQADAANAISVSRQTISSYESGRTQPDLETLKHLAEVYQADIQDVLYGGDRLQRKLNWVRLAAFILVAIVLLGILAHSVLFWTLSRFLPITTDSTTVELRFALRGLAETASNICTAVFTIGCIAMLFPSIAVVQYIRLHKLIAFFVAAAIAMFVFAVPFAINDTGFGLADYLFPVWSALVVLLLFFAVLLLAKAVKQHRSS